MTALAFFFVPVSLASSIYGMNIQQINSTGHDVTAFICTALVLLALTFVAWILSSLLVSFRNYRIETYEERKEARQFKKHREFIDQLLFVGTQRNWAKALSSKRKH
ncbi:hypothetical protein EJ04DRAFT_580794 [Polyplosphaeria fusca]|uniref:Uncharacterized protein n=1 Tax=Polyplosphaeria fusca TaxID=682080 RepID=A0A9P4UXP6_9PLEO|nr:hypothetical protein EJ04DRAFT_580794 [Polyplosphaeria fusca]